MFTSMRRRLADQEAALTELRATVRGLQQEWEDTHDKLLHMVRRWTMRAKRAEALAEDAEPADDVAPSVDPITDRIMRRRHVRTIRRTG